MRLLFSPSLSYELQFYYFTVLNLSTLLFVKQNNGMKQKEFYNLNLYI